MDSVDGSTQFSLNIIQELDALIGQLAVKNAVNKKELKVRLF